MTELRLPFPAGSVGKSGLSADGHRQPQSTVLADALCISADAATILALHDFHLDSSEEWNAFFLDAISEFVVHDTRSGGPGDGGDMRLVLPEADFARLRAISDTIDPALIDSEWKEFLNRAEPCAFRAETSRWLRVSDDIFALDDATG